MSINALSKELTLITMWQEGLLPIKVVF